MLSICRTLIKLRSFVIGCETKTTLYELESKPQMHEILLEKCLRNDIIEFEEFESN